MSVFFFNWRKHREAPTSKFKGQTSVNFMWIYVDVRLKIELEIPAYCLLRKS